VMIMKRQRIVDADCRLSCSGQLHLVDQQPGQPVRIAPTLVQRAWRPRGAAFNRRKVGDRT
jgi:hypothetical protein